MDGDAGYSAVGASEAHALTADLQIGDELEEFSEDTSLT